MASRRLSGSRPHRPTGLQIATVLAVLAMVYLLVLPLGVQIITALRGPYLPFGLDTSKWGLGNFRALAAGISGGIGETILTTAEFVVGATVISMLLGWTLAWLVVRTTLPFRRTITALIIIPFTIPFIVQSAALLMMLQPKTGMLNQLLRLLPWWNADSGPLNPFAFWMVVVVQGASMVTFPFMFLMPILLNMDGTLEEAGRAAGGSPLEVFRRITVPTLWPGTLGVMLLQAILIMGSLEIPLMFGQQSASNIVSLKIYQLINGPSVFPSYGLAAAYGVVFLALTAIIFQLYRRTTRRADRIATVTGKGMRAVRYPIGRWKIPVLIFIALYVFVELVLPLVSLVWTAITPYQLPLTLHNLTTNTTWNGFSVAFSDTRFWESLERTFIIAGTAATIAVTNATIAAYVVARSKRTLATRILDILASSSIAIPAVIAGFAIFMLYLVTNKYVHLDGTIWALILAYSYQMAIGYRTVYASIFQVSGELEEASASSGATRMQTLRRIILPLVFPTIVINWIGSFILACQEFTLAAFLATPSTEPASIYMYQRLLPGTGVRYQPNQGAAMALIFSAAIVTVGLTLRALGARAQRHKAQRNTASPGTGVGKPVASAAAGAHQRDGALVAAGE